MIQSSARSLQYLNECEVAPKTFRPLNHLQAVELDRQFKIDAFNFGQAGIASLIDSLIGIAERRFNWSIVKLYYVVFYCLRARLLLRGVNVFYRNRSPYSIHATPGSSFTLQKGNSHTAVFKIFCDQFKFDVSISQPISGEPPLDWIEAQRNNASYGTAPFPDPTSPYQFEIVDGALRRWVSVYFSDQEFLYAFQPEHAMLAYPILSLCLLNEELSATGESFRMDVHYERTIGRAECSVVDFRTLSSFFW